MRRLILRNHQSPGDIVMLTAAVRDLHRTYPNEFVTDVRTPCQAIWENNPYITPLDEGDGVEVVDCRPCIVVAGGRESPRWKVYPHHNSSTQMVRIAAGKSRTVPLGGSSARTSSQLCHGVWT